MCPIFEYQCVECESIKEVICPFIYEEPVVCCVCLEERLMHRIISSGGFILKGVGLYKPTRD